MSEQTWSLPSRDKFVRLTGEVALASGLAAILWSLILAWRLSGVDPSHGLLYYWIPLTAVGIPPSLALVFSFRSGAHGARVLWPEQEDAERRTTFVALAIVGSLVGWAAAGFVLSAFTHHRGLGATTFAFLATGWMGLTLLVAWRATGWIHRSAWSFLWSRLAGVVAAVAVVYFLAKLLRSTAAGSPGLAQVYAVFDAAVLVGLGMVFSRVRLRRGGHRLVVPAILAVVVGQVVLGVGALSRLVDAHGAVDQRVKIVSPLTNLLRHPDTTPKRIRKAPIR